MKLRTLGKTDIQITPIGQGVMQLSSGSRSGNLMRPPIPEQDANDIIKTAIDYGINWFDTAEAYGFGASERNLSRGLQVANIKDEEVVIATKWMPMMRWAGSIKKTIHNRIENLHPYTIDLHQIHLPYSFSSLNSQLNNMADLVEEGKVRSVGVSNFSANQMRKAHEVLEKRGIPLSSNQVNYNLLKRKIERNGVLEAAQELGITIICWGPLHSGLLTGKFHSDPKLLKSKGRMRRRSFSRKLEKSQPLIDELARIAESHDATVSQVALSWLVNYHGETVVAIPGATKASQSQINGQAMSINLSTGELSSIDELSQEFI
ncbi:MAG: aldo/keto reductase [Candidatus Heimdallarchaeota archaeon]|nr:MAG: aldo/keto reductase [Candidatus Heimdallarchaeota archaeon]